MALAATAVLAGCGGGGGDNGGGGGPGPGPVDPTPQVVLAASSEVEFQFLTGLGRRDIDPVVAIVNRIAVSNGPLQDDPDYVQRNVDGFRIGLNQYTANSAALGITVPTGQSSKHYAVLPLEFADFGTLDTTGQFNSSITNPGILPYGVRLAGQVPAADVRVFKGRQSAIPIRVDESMFTITGSSITLNEQFFTDVNVDPATGRINSYLSDYVAFDLSALANADRPRLASGAPADLVLLTGDAVALSSGFDSGTSFEILGANLPTNGVIRRPQIIEGVRTPGTYTLLEPDPRDIVGEGRVIAGTQGIWRNFTEVLANYGGSLVVLFPNSRNSDSMDMVAAVLNNGRITRAFVGKATINRNGGAPTNGTFTVYPASELGKTNPTGGVSGNLTGLTTLDDAGRREVMNGDYNFTGGAFGFPSTGKFVVFRR